MGTPTGLVKGPSTGPMALGPGPMGSGNLCRGLSSGPFTKSVRKNLEKSRDRALLDELLSQISPEISQDPVIRGRDINMDDDIDDTKELTPRAQFFIDSYDLIKHPCWKETGSQGLELVTTVGARLLVAAKKHDLPVDVVAESITKVADGLGDVVPERWSQYFQEFSHGDTGQLEEFMDLWLQSGFARLQVGHKLAAALALTTEPTELKAPWKAWSLVIPDGFFTGIEVNLDRTLHFDLKRAWFIGTRLIAVLGDTVDNGRQLNISIIDEAFGVIVNADIIQLIKNMGACALAIVQTRHPKQSGSWGSVRSKSNAKRLLTPGVGADYQLAAPIKIDMRDDLKRATTGVSRTSSLPKAYWIVRGHMKRVHHGPNKSLTKIQWIEPYPKGDPELRVLMRTTIIE